MMRLGDEQTRRRGDKVISTLEDKEMRGLTVPWRAQSSLSRLPREFLDSGFWRQREKERGRELEHWETVRKQGDKLMQKGQR